MNHGQAVRADLTQATADELYDAVRSRAWGLYPHVPALVSVGRLGRYDGAWDPDRRPGRDGYHPVEPGPAGERETEELAALVLAYAAHPDADRMLISRPHGDRFPSCVDLYLA